MVQVKDLNHREKAGSLLVQVSDLNHLFLNHDSITW